MRGTGCWAIVTTYHPFNETGGPYLRRVSLYEGTGLPQIVVAGCLDIISRSGTDPLLVDLLGSSTTDNAGFVKFMDVAGDIPEAILTGVAEFVRKETYRQVSIRSVGPELRHLTIGPDILAGGSA